jgi:uncharacterized protein YcbK (DUF882 family)
VKYFKQEEFLCKCRHDCDKDKVRPDDGLLVLLDKARELAGVPFVVESGIRCPEHNAEVGGVDSSAHIWGLAVDIRAMDSVTRYKVLRAMFDVGFKRIGIGANFIHVDTDSSKGQEVCWLYPSKPKDA